MIALNSVPIKRKRSASTASEVPILATLVESRVDPPESVNGSTMPPPSTAQTSGTAKAASGRAKRGGGRKNVSVDPAAVDGDDGESH